MRDNLYVILAGVAAGVYGLAKVDPPPKPAAAPTTQSAGEIIIRDDPPAAVNFGWVPPAPEDVPQVVQGPCPGGICPLPERPAAPAPQPVQAAPAAVYRSAGSCSAGVCTPARRGLFGRIFGRR